MDVAYSDGVGHRVIALSNVFRRVTYFMDGAYSDGVGHRVIALSNVFRRVTYFMDGAYSDGVGHRVIALSELHLFLNSVTKPFVLRLLSLCYSRVPAKQTLTCWAPYRDSKIAPVTPLHSTMIFITSETLLWIK